MLEEGDSQLGPRVVPFFFFFPLPCVHSAEIGPSSWRISVFCHIPVSNQLFSSIALFPMDGALILMREQEVRLLQKKSLDHHHHLD